MSRPCSRNYQSCGRVSCWVHNCSLEQWRPYVRKPKQQANLFSGNYNQVLDLGDAKLKTTPVYPLLLLIGEVLDQASLGEDVYVSIGKNRGKSAFVLTVTWDGDKLYAPGLDIIALAEGCASLLNSES